MPTSKYLHIAPHFVIYQRMLHALAENRLRGREIEKKLTHLGLVGGSFSHESDKSTTRREIFVGST